MTLKSFTLYANIPTLTTLNVTAASSRPQVGPQEKRPASLRFNEWVTAAVEKKEARLTRARGLWQMGSARATQGVLSRQGASHGGKEGNGRNAGNDRNYGNDGKDGNDVACTDTDAAANAVRRPNSLSHPQSSLSSPSEPPRPALSAESHVQPLALFNPDNASEMLRLYHLVKDLPELVHYYLRQHVFPKTMNFQRLKISACGHELGSDILFRRRIGFSGTPSNLLPMDLDECKYEPGSDGKVLHVLTSPKVRVILRLH